MLKDEACLCGLNLLAGRKTVRDESSKSVGIGGHHMDEEVERAGDEVDALYAGFAGEPTSEIRQMRARPGTDPNRYQRLQVRAEFGVIDVSTEAADDSAIDQIARAQEAGAGSYPQSLGKDIVGQPAIALEFAHEAQVSVIQGSPRRANAIRCIRLLHGLIRIRFRHNEYLPNIRVLYFPIQ